MTREADHRCAHRARAGACGRARGDGGSVSLEVAILGPALLLLIFTIVQAGLWFHARSLALAAAQEGVTAARAYRAGPATGTSRARLFLTEHAGDSVAAARITSTGTTSTQIRIQVRGRALSVLPGIPGLTVSQSAEGPVERFTTASRP
jgi:Flp pilus assembly protein TadG